MIEADIAAALAELRAKVAELEAALKQQGAYISHAVSEKLHALKAHVAGLDGQPAELVSDHGKEDDITAAPSAAVGAMATSTGTPSS